MHEKLSQAVKLYDQLLTEQLSRPSWRSAPPQEAPPQTGYGQYPQPNGAAYNQWQPEPQQVQQVSSPSIQTQAPSYFSQPNGASYDHQQQMYQPQATPVLGPSSPSQSQQGYRQENVPYGAMSPPPVSVLQYGASPTAPPPVSYQPAAQAPPPPIQHQTHPQPQSQYSQQPQQQQQHYAAPPSPGLARHNTVAASYRPAQAQAPARANTLAPSHTQTQLQQLQQTSVPLPSFPQVPATHPQYANYDAYGASPPEPERKEALLIDL